MVWMDHILFIHFLSDMGCFRLLALVNNAAMNVVCRSLESLLPVLLGKYLGVELLGQKVIPIFFTILLYFDLQCAYSSF